MPKYVDVEKAYEFAKTYFKDFARSVADLTSLKEVLEFTPSADVKEVCYGEWVETITETAWSDDPIVWYTCSHCARRLNTNTEHYCPNCGTQMI